MKTYAIRLAAIAVATVVAGSTCAAATSLEEVVVTASSRGQGDLPGAYLKRKGDFLLLEVSVTNDTREEEARKREIYDTLKNALTAASRQSGIELSVIDQQENVIALTRDNYEVDLHRGDRPDTSATSIRVKKKIPETVADADQMVADLLKFVKQIPVVGRTKLDANESVDISIVDPNQYRAQIIQRFAEDVAQVKAALGQDYRLIVENIDRPVKFSRVGPLEVALFIPYHYTIVPTSISSIMRIPD